MRICEESIDVRRGEVQGVEAPAQFLWRNRLWSVRSVETRWIVTGRWWDSAAARAVRDGSVAVVDAGEVLTEEEVWRVVAANGRTGTRGVYELTHVVETGEWRLSRIVD
ncbi:MAG TPA: hypothetical protein GXZ30_02715 [Propionibacterium sp.]|jgi:hypothetical protein|nr:hypothetical protein [Propionibacterium sp.]